MTPEQTSSTRPGLTCCALALSPYDQLVRDLLWRRLLESSTESMNGTETQGHLIVASAPEYDVFISHAWEDKATFVQPLADALRARNVRVWYDVLSLQIGDSLSESIDTGLRSSAYGLVVLSTAFFEKHWPKRELRGLEQKASSEGRKVILPIWHGVTHKDVAGHSLPLADLVAIDSAIGVEAIADRVAAVVLSASDDASKGRARLALRTPGVSLGLDATAPTPPADSGAAPAIRHRSELLSRKTKRPAWWRAALMMAFILVAMAGIGLLLSKVTPPLSKEVGVRNPSVATLAATVETTGSPRSSATTASNPEPKTSKSTGDDANQTKTYPASDRAFRAKVTEAGRTVRVPARWKASTKLSDGIWTCRINGTSGIVMTFVSPKAYDPNAERRQVRAAGYYKEVEFSKSDGSIRWQYHARNRDSSQLMHVDVWYFPATNGDLGLIVRSAFPTVNGRDDSGEVRETTGVVASLE